jgi:hypothetical protein
MTKKTLIKIQVILLAMFIQGCSAESVSSKHEALNVRDGSEQNSDKKYPPYPDVWHYIANPLGRASLFFISRNGDIVIRSSGYFDSGEHDLTKSVSIASFFSKEFYPSNENLEKIGLVNLKPGRQGEPFKMANGNSVRSKSSSGGSKCSDDFAAYIEIKNPSGKSLGRYRLLYIPEKSTYDKGSFCEADVSREVRVISMHPQFIALQDDTFLAASHNLVVRFRSDLTTESSLMNKKLFLVSLDIDPYKVLGKALNQPRDMASDQAVWYEYLTKTGE